MLSCLVSGVCSLAVAASIPAILPTSASAPRAVTIIMPLPCVTGVFMNAMFVRSPGPEVGVRERRRRPWTPARSRR